MMKRFVVIACMAVLLMTALLSVAGFSPANSTPINAEADLRVVNALVGLGAVDVYLDGYHIAYGLPPEQATPYITLPVGRHTLTIRPVNADQYAIPIADILVDLIAGQSQTAIVYQKIFASQDYAPGYEQAGAIMLLNDDRSPLELGKARLTAVHLAPGTPESLSILDSARAPLLHQIHYEQVFGTIDLKAGVYNALSIANANSSNLDRIQGIGQRNFTGNTLYTFIIVPNVQPVGDGRAGVVPAISAEPHLISISAPINRPPDGMRMRLIHAGYTATQIDVYIDGKLIAERMRYRSFSEYLGLEGRSHVITLRRAGAAPDTVPLAEASFSIAPRDVPFENWTLLLVNNTPENSALLSATLIGVQQSDRTQMIASPNTDGTLAMTIWPDNLSRTSDRHSRIRLIHALDGFPPLSLFTPAYPLYDLLPGVTPTFTPTPETGQENQLVSLVSGAGFAASAQQQEFQTGIYQQLNVLVTSGLNEIKSVPQEHLVSGLIYTYVVVGSASGNPPIDVIELQDFGYGAPPELREGETPTPTPIPIVVTRAPVTATLFPSLTPLPSPTRQPQTNTTSNATPTRRAIMTNTPRPTSTNVPTITRTPSRTPTFAILPSLTPTLTRTRTPVPPPTNTLVPPTNTLV
ncbi:MAG: DUF4397 domain-containing protein, partial [Anaerolineae bacterium]|nr:DUF4397 domain-containing protein [Anaerolineae bacterium]